MATTEEVQKLAALARITVEDAELEKFTSEFDAILAYIGQLEKLELPEEERMKPALRNVMRVDGEPHATGRYTEKLTEQFPARLPAQAGEGVYLEVKQILSHD